MSIAVFVSGNGSNLQAIIDACDKGEISSKIALVVSNKEDAYALERAQKSNIETFVIDPKGKIAHAWYNVKATGHVERVKTKLAELAG